MACQICKENLTRWYQTFQFGVIFGSLHLQVISLYNVEIAVAIVNLTNFGILSVFHKGQC